MTAATLTHDQDYPTLSLVGLAHGTSHFYHFLLPTLYPWLMPAFGLDFTQAGSLMAMFFLVSGIGQALAGLVVDRFGASRVLLAGLGMLAAAALVLSLASGYPALLASAALLGLGNCVFHPADYTILNRRVSPARLGQAFSVHGLAGNAGWVLCPPLVVAVATQAGWRAAAASAAAVGLATIAVVLFARDLVRVEVPAGSARQAASAGHGAASGPVAGGPTGPVSTLAVLGLPAVWLCFGYFLFSSAAFGTLQNFAGPLLGHLHGLAASLAAACMTAYLVGSTAGTALGGWYAHEGRSHERTILVALGVSALAACVLALVALPAPVVLALLALMGLGVGMTGPSRDLLVRAAATRSLGPAALGRVYGFVYSGLDAGLAVAPLLFGPWMDRGLFRGVMFGIALLQGLAMAVAVAVGSRRPAA